jgi:CoA:oxalate CoA-transferase
MRLREDLPDSTRPIEVPDCLHRPTDRQTYPYYRVYETGDGYISIAALNRGLREKVCATLEIHDDHIERNSGDISDTAYFKQKNIMRTIEDRLRSESSEHWLKKLEAAGVPCTRVNYRSDLYADGQAQALNLIWELENRDLGKYKASGNPIRFLKTPIKPKHGAPGLGEHSETVLLEFGYAPEEIGKLKASGVLK